MEGVITLNKDTFYGVGTLPCIAVFTAHQPHPEDKLVKFINFEDDGYKVFPHIGLVETESAIDKKNIYLMYGLIELMLNQSFVLNLLLNLMMNGYIVFIILMMKFQQKKNLIKQLLIT